MTRPRTGGGRPGKDLAKQPTHLSNVAVRVPVEWIDLIDDVEAAQRELALRDGSPGDTNRSVVLRSILSLGLYEWRLQHFVKWMTQPNALFTVPEAAQKLRLPETLLRREAAARGVSLPPATEPEAAWPRPRTPIPPVQPTPEVLSALPAELREKLARILIQ